MFNPVFSTVQQSQILINRLQRLQNQLRSLVAFTEVDYQAAVYSALNAILNLGNKMLPPAHLTPESPAIIGDLSTNLNNLNADAQDIAAELVSVETQLAQFFNLMAGVQNTLRQSIREQVFASTNAEFIEDFVNNKQLQSGYTVSIDFNEGIASAPLISDKPMAPAAIVVGSSSISATPTANASYDPMQLLNPAGLIDNLVSWSGSQLELQLQFTTPTPINRLTIQLDNYNGLEISSLTSSPDGLFFDQIDAELNPSDLQLGAESGKFSGDVIIDFNPRNVTVLKLVFVDVIGQGFINLRGLQLNQRSYSPSGLFSTSPISSPSGDVQFNTVQRIYPQLTTIIHQISYDGVHYTVIQPGDVISLVSSPFWYKAELDRLEDNFSGITSPINQGTADPTLSTNYTISNITSVNLNGGVTQRTIAFSSINSGSVVFNETPIPGTLAVYFGSVLQNTSAYTFANNTLTLTTMPQSNVTVKYQTSFLGTTGLGNLKPYFSPYLLEATFTKV